MAIFVRLADEQCPILQRSAFCLPFSAAKYQASFIGIGQPPLRSLLRSQCLASCILRIMSFA
jgi:hypothetical protein